MPQNARRTARRRRLGTALREAREAAEITATQAAQTIHSDNTKLSRIETGRHRVTRLELETLFALYEVKDEKLREWLIALAAEGNKRSWWRKHSDKIGPDLKELLSLEADAARITTFQAHVVPGLLQTRNYAAAIISGCNERLTKEEVEFYVDLRMARQDIFQREEPTRHLVIVYEGVLRQQIGGRRVLAEQLRHLISLSRPPEMTIQVIPFSQGAFDGARGSFSMFSYPDPLDFDVVQVEYLDGALYLEEDATVKKYQRAIDGLRAAALSSSQSTEMIASIARELET
ncbi:helix-turn-helix domain-containing protein [Streptomyces sp. AV19]|uniref:helix-turn-helix domain-containing protein n=1 Tax=Streptomyces sp. AV19 TaxID=2793068 RepID=UPI0018FEAC8B|nr:helix-turn-helix transcriptional regulator [Streptomyces sp. AV19]MBH1932866.1 helix-turn-helix domain-containing protein [Streptomyces sp. AV19]MDG4531544.1 helix-turn-helix domain-containing protein [Streptomyces sp. AV19]